MRLKKLRYTLALGACAVFLFSGCGTTQVKELEDENLALKEKISELEAKLAAEEAAEEAVSEMDKQDQIDKPEGEVASVRNRQDHDPTLEEEIARLKLLNELLLEANGSSTLTVKPNETSLTVGTGRIRVTQAVNNNGFLSFLSAENRPDDRGRASAGSAQAVSVSWLDAVQYCNWLSAQWQYDAYYVVNGTEVQLNAGGRRNGYRLPSQAELDASVRNGSLSMDAVSRVGLLSSEPNRAYRYDRTRNSLVPLDASLPVNNIGFMVVRNEN